MYGESPITTLHVRVDGGRTRQFSGPFHVGRSADCDVQVDDDSVSRKHLLVSVSDGQWSFSDLQSSNGVFVNGIRTAAGPIGEGLTLHLGGHDGPALAFRVERSIAATASRRSEPGQQHAGASEPHVVASYKERYFGSHDPDEPAGPRTMYIRQAFQEVQKKQRRQYVWVLGVLAVAALSAALYAWHTHHKMIERERNAADLFYFLKAMDVRIARMERALAEAGASADQKDVQAQRAERRQWEAQYDTFLKGHQFYGRPLTDQERLILRVTRIFGECELLMPREYLAEVDVYIKKWQSTKRFETAVARARDNGYIQRIVDEFAAKNLPEQFFYLAMQESSFNPRAVGTPTRYGFAKGMWQFIRDTGREYGLQPGPLAHTRDYDPDDERFQWEKATNAAARYIKTIYATDAQASGLLVIASYNWGQGRVIDRVRSMPDNPRDRNFWKLLSHYRSRIPKETYDYVFYIVSAAVIGENPRLFGFQFDNPLLGATRRTADAAATTRRGVDRVVSASR